MKPITLLLTQLLPLVVFVVVDAFVTDVRISIASAVLFAFGQLVLTWVRHRRFDWFVLLDVAVISVLGAISIAFDDEVFFEVKPAIVEGLTILLMVGLIAAPGRFLLRYLGRMTPGVTLRPEAVGTMKSMLAVMSVCVVLHVGAVLYAALRSTRQTWAFVSGPGFYIALLPMVVAVVIARRRSRNARAREVKTPRPD